MFRETLTLPPYFPLFPGSPRGGHRNTPRHNLASENVSNMSQPGLPESGSVCMQYSSWMCSLTEAQ